MTRIDTHKLTRWYDFQAPFYAFWRNDFDGELVRAVVETVAVRAPKRVLDCGCGSGLFAIPLARRLAGTDVVGIDLSAGMLKVAEAARIQDDLSNLVFQRGDATKLPFKEQTFDTVVMAGLLPNVNDRVGVLKEARRVLAPGGTVFVVEFDRTAMGTGARLVFRTMILGYKAVSTVFRRFRFADGWNLRASTVDRAELTAWLDPAGLTLNAVERRAGHAIYDLTGREGIA